MSIAEMKEKISEEVNRTDDEKVLHQFLEVLNSKQRNNINEINAAKHIDKLFKKRDGLLKKAFMMFNLQSVLHLHDEVLQQYGGASGVRGNNLLDSALHRPFQTFGGEDLYPSLLEKAVAVLQSIIINHPFVDGNKRTGVLLCEILLMEDNLESVSS